MNTNGKACYQFPKVEVSHVVLEGCLAASFIQITPETDSFKHFNWDELTDTDSQDIRLLY